ncbi:RNA polymerase, sigma-24 subunit, ECF subfamily [Catenulispora acidiphila DSM 44928]|uniref:RNA polymerase, sigma-24 subunit, ECF subfamily n=1 Tax=Catenulispora acidiphila (strain DSM 44928 / JCM 14897 / NBRC 102108 / NRRL B-24433 / ID139908) TaxID=479433 RepID=C7Q0I4_CATAD|nr:RNA polymerase sigma factor SigJ [Catenulispora acidiphila]ACU77517.1 RNA polymerase, sigma-24 subunit, ECF subfamily [Catenulispora acidiphila DSM 44928]
MNADFNAIMSGRRQLINLGYRLLGSLADAEDVVQETYARWYAMSAEEQQAIEAPGAWLMTVASRICLNQLASARVRRETYVGEWIPEPLPEPTEWIAGRTGTDRADPADRVTLDESVTMAFLVVLDALTPAERVAFVLHDVYGYPFGEVAEIVGRTPAACRQLASSARRRIRSAQPPASRSPNPSPNPSQSAGQAEIVRDFKAAWAAQDIQALIGLLDPDATATADGGGLVTTHVEPIVGGVEIARAYAELAGVVHGHTTFVECSVNGLPGLAALREGRTVSVFAFEIAGERIRRIWAVANPEKIRPWQVSLGD